MAAPVVLRALTRTARALATSEVSLSALLDGGVVRVSRQSRHVSAVQHEFAQRGRHVSRAVASSFRAKGLSMCDADAALDEAFAAMRRWNEVTRDGARRFETRSRF